MPIPGTKRVRWLEQNVGALGLVLDAEVLAELDPLGDKSSALATESQEHESLTQIR